MRQHPASYREQPGGGHDEPDRDIDHIVERFEGEPLRQAEIGQFAGQTRLYRERRREQEAGAQAPRGRIAADRIAEGDRPGMLVGGHAVDDPEQKRRQQVDSDADMRRVPQIDPADHAGPPLSAPAPRQSRHNPRNTTWWSRIAAPVARSTAAKRSCSIRHGTGTSSWQRVQ